MCHCCHRQFAHNNDLMSHRCGPIVCEMCLFYQFKMYTHNNYIVCSYLGFFVDDSDCSPGVDADDSPFLHNHK